MLIASGHYIPVTFYDDLLQKQGQLGGAQRILKLIMTNRPLMNYLILFFLVPNYDPIDRIISCLVHIITVDRC